MSRDEPATGRERIRRDSHLALGCGFAFALTVVSIVIIYLLVGA